MTEVSFEEFRELLLSVGASEECFDADHKHVELHRLRRNEEALARVGRLQNVTGVRSIAYTEGQKFPAFSSLFPALETIRVQVDAKRTPNVSVEHPNVTSCTINLSKRPATESVSITGNLPALQTLTINRSVGATTIRIDPLVQLCASARAPLQLLALQVSDAWQTLRVLVEKLGTTKVRQCSGRSYEDNRSFDDVSIYGDQRARDALRAREWDALLAVQSMGIEAHPHSVWWLVDNVGRFHAVQGELVHTTKELFLEGPLHTFILREPSLLKDFSSLTSLRIFNAEGLSSENLLWLSAHLPLLRELSITNSHDPTLHTLALASKSLKELSLLHCHTLRSFELDCPALEEIIFENCDAETVEPHGDANDQSCSGNFYERFLRELLDGAPTLRLPALRSYIAGTSQQAMGMMPVFEDLRVDVPCRVGHPKLEVLSLFRCNHLRSLTLRALPSLRRLSVYDDEREEGEEGWLEAFDDSALTHTFEKAVMPVSRPRKARIF